MWDADPEKARRFYFWLMAFNMLIDGLVMIFIITVGMAIFYEIDSRNDK